MRADSRRYTGLDIFGLLDAGWYERRMVDMFDKH